MSLLSKVGAFNTGTAAAGNTVAITGVGFQPKAVIFWWAGLTGTIDAFSGGNIQRGIGVATAATSRWAVGSRSENVSAASNTDRIQRADACIATVTNANLVEALMDLQSLDSDGFTLVVDDAFPASYRILYLALGGSDLTDAATGRFSEPNAIGDQDITGVGFQPDFIMLGSINLAADPPAASTSGFLSVGAAVSASQQAVMANIAVTAQASMLTRSYAFAGEVTAEAGAPTAAAARAAFDSFLADGFRLDWLESNSTRRIFYLALKGGSYRIDNFLTSVTPAATITETGFGFAPKATMLFSTGKVQNTQDAVTAPDQWNVGAFTSTTERGAQGTFDESAVADSDLELYVEHDVALAQITATPSLVGEVDVQSIDVDGFTLVMDSAADPAAFVWYFAVGDTPVAPSTVTVSGTTVTITTSGTVTILDSGSNVVYSGGSAQITLPADAYTWTDDLSGSGSFSISGGAGNRMGGSGAIRKPPRNVTR